MCMAKVAKGAKVAKVALALAISAAEGNVTVHLDATYATDASRGPVCSGVGPLPSGAACPLKGDVAIADCHDKLPTYNGTACVARANAVCVIGAESKWSCAFPVGDGQVGDLTSTLTIASELASDESPWGDLPWRAPPRVEVQTKAPEHGDALQSSAVLQVQ
ncbi:unnamed protein product [Phytophthora fragariaefolia]|uniref:Unnamed protein product n=1 Tax=Phytophthora fragariaefolia TaxID=1490495 RepID=A0A9W6U1J2_9STRA|nr:unnamed protein product [Phytophthora fragariaefolia]